MPLWHRLNIKYHIFDIKYHIFENILFPENIRKKCSDLKPGFWKGFPTEIIITRQPYNRNKSADKLSIYQGLGYKSRWVQKIRVTRVD